LFYSNQIYAILPAPIVNALRDKKQHTPVKHDDVSILFAEVVDFETNISAVLSPEESVVFLNRIYSIFERLIDNHKLEKIRTFGPVILIAGKNLRFFTSLHLFLL
jgi:adenylate cyclase